MNDNVLKITAIRRKGDPFKSKYSDNSSIPEGEKCREGGWYLHGQLESEVGYNIGFVTNCVSAGYCKPMIDWSWIEDGEVRKVRSDKLVPAMYISGEVPVEVEGFDRPCTGFFWINLHIPVKWKGQWYDHWSQRGLVCFSDDLEACKYARQHMLSNANYI